MTNFFRQHKSALAILAVISALYFVLRLPGLTLQPVFADEAIYIRWAQIMKAEPTLRFVSLQDGKTPLYMWAMAPFFKVFADPLLAGRLLSVLSGFLTLSGAVFLGWKFFNKRVGLWAGFLMATAPFIVFFDRMALVDSMLAAFSIWSLNLSLLLIKYQRLDLAMFLGYVLGGGMLTKTPGMFSFLTLPTVFLTFAWQGKNRDRRLVKALAFFAAAALIGLGIYNILRLGPGFEMLSSRNQDYIFSPLDLAGRPLDPFIPHLKDLADWLPKLLTWPILLLLLGGIVLSFAKKNLLALAVLAWALLPLLANLALLKTFTARYILFSIPPLLCLSAWAIDSLAVKIKAGKTIVAAAIGLILLPLPLYFIFRLWTNPALAPLPREERQGYLEEWTAGYGFSDIAQYLMNEAQKGSVVVGTEGSFGTLPEGLGIYLDKYSHTALKDQQVTVIGGKATISAQLRQTVKEHPTFFVANKSRFLGADNLQLIWEYPKAVGEKGQDAILFFRVLPLKSNN